MLICEKKKKKKKKTSSIYMQSYSNLIHEMSIGIKKHLLPACKGIQKSNP